MVVLTLWDQAERLGVQIITAKDDREVSQSKRFLVLVPRYPMFSNAFSVPQLFGYVAFVLGVSSFLQKNDRHFKLYMAAECVAYVVHFYLLGNPTAVLSSFLSAGRSVLSLYTRSRWIAAGVVVINLVVGGMLVQHWWNWLPPLASCVGTLALFLLRGRKMRILMLLGTALWIVNNVISGSIGGTALECVILCVNLTTIWRMSKDLHLLQEANALPKAE